MNNLKLNKGDKQMVAFPNGAKAVLIFRGQYKKMHIDYYQPSAAYFNHIKGKQRIVVKDGQIVKERHNLSKFGTHLHLINVFLSGLFKTKNPEADDSWLNDTWNSEEKDWIRDDAPSQIQRAAPWKITRRTA